MFRDLMNAREWMLPLLSKPQLDDSAATAIEYALVAFLVSIA